MSLAVRDVFLFLIELLFLLNIHFSGDNMDVGTIVVGSILR